MVMGYSDFPVIQESKSAYAVAKKHINIQTHILMHKLTLVFPFDIEIAINAPISILSLLVNI